MDERLNLGNGFPPSAKGLPAFSEDVIRPGGGKALPTSTAFLFACVGLLLLLGGITELWVSNAKVALSLTLSSAVGLVMVIPGCAAGMAANRTGNPPDDIVTLIALLVVGCGLLAMADQWAQRSYNPLSYLLTAFVFGAFTLTRLRPAQLFAVAALLLGADVFLAYIRHGAGQAIQQTLLSDGLCALIGVPANLRLWRLDQQQRLSTLEALADPLTGLANRRALERIAEIGLRYAQRERRAVTVAVLDLDKFKSVNDLHGHDVGDSVLQLVADGLRQFAQRPLDCIARLGGDEFVIFWFDLDIEQAGRLGRELVASVGTRPLRLPVGTAIQPKISLGACSGVPHGATRLDELLRLADRALYQVKHESGNRALVRSIPGSIGRVVIGHNFRISRPYEPRQGEVSKAPRSDDARPR